MNDPHNSLADLNGEQIIAKYILHCRNRGVFLTRDEYLIIEKWLLDAQSDPDIVLLVLSDILPSYYQSNTAKRSPSIARIDRKVRSRIQNLICKAL